MDAADRAQMLQLLSESRDNLVGAAAGVSDDQARIRPAQDRWSVLDCAEHVAIVENFLLKVLTTKLSPCAPSEERSREAFFLRSVANRTQKVMAPDMSHPSGRFATLVEALDYFRQSRARAVAFVEQCTLDLRALSAPHPLFGPMTGREFLIILALHPARHAEQIREVRAALGLV
jgi:uncharacterized damage-inducible protein DinB